MCSGGSILRLVRELSIDFLDGKISQTQIIGIRDSIVKKHARRPACWNGQPTMNSRDYIEGGVTVPSVPNIDPKIENSL